MRNADAAQILTKKLDLDSPPIALAVRDDPPAGCHIAKDTVPSACSFWREAQSGLFFAAAEAHFNCPIGAMVMGFELPKTTKQELMGMVDTMTACGYVSSSEAAHIPTYPKLGAKGVLYGTLNVFPGLPDVILVWLSPLQAMVWNEATGAAAWDSKSPALVTGRPACAALPRTLLQDKAALSLGCAGMRTFTGIGDDRLLGVIPGNAIADFCDKIARISRANAAMKALYDGRLAAAGAG